MRLFTTSIALFLSFFCLAQGNMLTLTGGTNEYVDLGNDPDRNFGSAGDPFTVEFYCYDTDNTAEELLAASNGNLAFKIVSGNARVVLKSGSGDSVAFASPISISTWEHLAIRMRQVSASDNFVSFYINGQSVDSATISWDPNLNTGQYYLGAYGTSSTASSASFEEVRFWNIERSVADLRWHVNDTLTLGEDDTTGLVGYFNMDTVSPGSVIYDSAATPTHGSLANATSSIVLSTAPTPYYNVVNGGDLYVASSWATGQGVPVFSNTNTKIRLKKPFAEVDINGGDIAWNIGSLIIDFAHASDADSTLKTPGSHSSIHGHGTGGVAPIMRELVVYGGNFHINEPVLVTQLIKTQRKPGNCGWCGDGELFIDPNGTLSFSGNTISMANSTTTVRGIFRVISSNHNFNLTNASIDIKPGGLFLSTGSGSNTWNMSGSSLTIEHGGGISNTGTAASITGTPEITFRTAFSSGVDGWRHFSSPNAKSGSRRPSNYNDDLTLDYTGGATSNIYTWDASENGATGEAVGWVAITDSTEDSWNKPYVIYETDTDFPVLAPSNDRISYRGSFGSGDVSTTTYNYFDPNAAQNSQNKGWNLIANPYPGALDPSAILNDYNGDGGGDDPAEFPFGYQGVHVWDPSAGQYVAVIASGESIVSHDSTTATISGGFSFIRPFTSFWVKMESGDADNETFTLKNAHRYNQRMGNGVDQFHKRSNPALRLNTYGPNHTADQSLMVFDPDATDNWDSGKEGYDLRSMRSDVPSTWFPTSDADQCILTTNIQVGVIKGQRMIVEAGSAGQYTIDMNRDEFGRGWDVWVVDSTAQKTHHLLTSPYNFQLSASGEQRSLYFMVSSSAVTLPEFETTQLYLLNDVSGWKVGIGDAQPNGSIQVMDLSGRVIANYPVTSSEILVPYPDHTGVYLLQWTRGNGSPLVSKAMRF